jgi:hypothetical protein
MDRNVAIAQHAPAHMRREFSNRFCDLIH